MLTRITWLRQWVFARCLNFKITLLFLLYSLLWKWVAEFSLYSEEELWKGISMYYLDIFCKEDLFYLPIYLFNHLFILVWTHVYYTLYCNLVVCYLFCCLCYLFCSIPWILEILSGVPFTAPAISFLSILLLPCIFSGPALKNCHFSKKPWQLLMENGIWKPRYNC